MKIERSAPIMSGRTDTSFETLFGSPVFIGGWSEAEALIPRLKAAAKAEQREAPNYTKYLVGGWRSRNDTLRRHDAEAFAAFEAFILDAAIRLTEGVNEGAPVPRTGWRAEIWANVSRAGAYHRSHAHRHDGCVWSGVFYADDGLDPGDAPSGILVLEDRSGVAVSVAPGDTPFRRERRIPARTGQVVIFSPWQFHRVETYAGRRERMSIAFNLFHDALKIPVYPDMAIERPNWRWEYFKGPMLALDWLKKRKFRRPAP